LPALKSPFVIKSTCASHNPHCDRSSTGMAKHIKKTSLVMVIH